jgi:hypothetical protein
VVEPIHSQTGTAAHEGGASPVQPQVQPASANNVAVQQQHVQETSASAHSNVAVQLQQVPEASANAHSNVAVQQQQVQATSGAHNMAAVQQQPATGMTVTADVLLGGFLHHSPTVWFPFSQTLASQLTKDLSANL